uniref:Uncharacterized protein n=1 Tax=Noctiluca scintillans TaxID=2966 RepID=A0A7S1B0Y8_NOCSC
MLRVHVQAICRVHGIMWNHGTSKIALLIVGNGLLFSTVSCAYVIIMILKLPKRLRNKLFARQLVYMGAFDIVLAGFSFYWVLLEGHFFIPNEDETSNTTMHVVQVIGCFSEYASILLELHIALGMAFSWARWESGLRVLDGSMCVIPALALASACVSAVTNPMTPSDTRPVFGRPTQLVGVVLICLVFMGCGFAYACALSAMRQSTFAAMRTVQRRFFLYPLNFVMSFGFKFVCDIDTELFGTFFGVLAAIGLAWNGFLNASTYFLQSRMSNGATTGLVVSNESQRLANIASFHAVFPRDNVHMVMGMQSLASSMRSEMEV